MALNYEIIGMAPCLADGARVRVTAMWNQDTGELLPYVNAVVKYASLDPGGVSITFKYRGCPVILERRRVTLGQLADLDEAEDIMEDLVDFLRRVRNKKAEITPLNQPKPQPQVHEIIRLLPRTNCGQCGESTCTAFALKLVLDRQKAENCLPLTGDEIRAVLKVLESLDNRQLMIK
ncbi:(Fe-S)-binding protein [Desulfolucanica intricata]|uniref:(Fe-S)-binding protein n=1 Tax=Desulfolucanica intricata TaxID=1285191 RepID=UPI00082B516E|nr:(Fe-S)-binding protein [Desulfolucanica intricata]